MSTETLVRKITCPGCGASGEALVSENNYPFMRSLAFAVEKEPLGFSVTAQSSDTRTVDTYCQACATSWET